MSWRWPEGRVEGEGWEQGLERWPRTRVEAFFIRFRVWTAFSKPQRAKGGFAQSVLCCINSDSSHHISSGLGGWVGGT